MVLARVIGTVVASRKEPSLVGLKLLLVKACDIDGKVAANGSAVVAVDAVGAGLGEVVLYASGSSARQTEVTTDRPVDATIMAIVDEVEAGNERRYAKGDDAESDRGPGTGQDRGTAQGAVGQTATALRQARSQNGPGKAPGPGRTEPKG